MEIRLLGRFAVRRGGRPLDDALFGGRRVRQLVRMLAVQRGRALSRDILIEALWGDQLPADPGSNLNVVVNRARRALAEPGVLETSSSGYLLTDAAAVSVDVETFEREVVRAREAHARGDVGAAADAARDALDLWGEPLAEDSYTDWARPHRDRLQRLHQEVLETACAVALARQQPRAAVDLAAQAVAGQPLREAAHLLLVRALAAGGDQAAALTAFLDFRKMLADELGVDPSSEAAAVYEQLVRGVDPTTSARRAHLEPHPVPLVGRDPELRSLTTLASGGVGLVAGRSGSGKSRLLAALVAATDRPVLLARGRLPERDDPWSVVRSLVEAAPRGAVNHLDALTRAALTDVLEGVQAPDRAVDERTRRALARQGLVRILEGTAPSLVVVDDLQWADSSSLDVLGALTGRGADVVSVLAYRPEEVPEDSPVARLLAQLGETAPVEVRLGALPPDALAGLATSREVAAALAEHTDGTPFAVLQVLRVLERQGLVRRTVAGAWEVTGEPPTDRVRELAHAGKREAVWRQFERQPRESRELLACLSLLGRPAPSRLLSAACGRDVDTLALLVDLGRHHLARHEGDGFRVEHDLIGETIRDRLDPVERARLHHLLADALEREDGPEDERARHLAGAGDTEAAAAAYASAARTNLDRYADQEAGALAEAGLRLDPPAGVRGALLEVRAEARARHGEVEAARDDLRAALGVASTGPDRARLLARLAVLTLGADDLLRASELADLAVAEAGDDQAARGRAVYTKALVDMNLDRPAAAEVGFAEALALFGAVGDTAGMTDIVEARAMLTFLSTSVTAGIDDLDRAAKLFSDNGNLLRAIFPRSTRGHALMFAARPEEGLRDTSEALDLARRLGNSESEAMVLWHHAEVLVACGRAEEALAVAQEGVALARSLRHRAGTAATLLAVGVARESLGDLTGAVAAFDASAETSGEALVLFWSWALARKALVLIRLGDLDQAESCTVRALDVAPDLAGPPARLARCTLAVVRGDENAPALVAEALELAVAGGHLATAERLRQLVP